MSKISSAVALSVEILGGAPLCRAFYKDTVQRMDLYSVDSSQRRSVNVSFEPGFAVDDLENNDLWY